MLVQHAVQYWVLKHIHISDSGTCVDLKCNSLHKYSMQEYPIHQVVHELKILSLVSTSIVSRLLPLSDTSWHKPHTQATVTPTSLKATVD